ncbi:hypothetical protein ACFYXF_23335 [Streptomyces sp. NPDC002680]|uniref:hypothetical protein n=1 Tax=Streptomyces sp. NPDC002680 TaxID=3364659 RepID=UPI00368CAB04
MRRAVYGPLCLADDVARIGAGEDDFTIRFTSVGVDKGGSLSIAWSGIHRIDAGFSAMRGARVLVFVASLLNLGVASGDSVAAKHSVLSISLKSGKMISWSFDVPPSGSVSKWNRKNVKILFEELSSLGMLPLLGSSVAAEQLFVRLGTVQPLFPGQRRRQIVGVITQIAKW